MKPVTQQFQHDLSVGQYGDCQRAVIASLLELPIEEVPHFLQDAKGDPVTYWEAIQRFCRSHGFAYLVVDKPGHAQVYGDDGDVYHEISGPSPRHADTFHAVIGKNGQVHFDPHPSRAGLAGDPSTWEHAYLVPVCDGLDGETRHPVARPRELEMLKLERRHLRSTQDRLLKILTGIHRLINPPPLSVDGKTLKFENPLASEMLDTLSNRIRAIPEELDAALKAGPMCDQCNGAGHIMAMSYGRGPDDYEYEAECPKCGGTGVPPASAIGVRQDRLRAKVDTSNISFDCGECPSITDGCRGRCMKAPR